MLDDVIRVVTSSEQTQDQPKRQRKRAHPRQEAKLPQSRQQRQLREAMGAATLAAAAACMEPPAHQQLARGHEGQQHVRHRAADLTRSSNELTSASRSTIDGITSAASVACTPSPSQIRRRNRAAKDSALNAPRARAAAAAAAATMSDELTLTNDEMRSTSHGDGSTSGSTL
eukprot:6181171-Pleurochrysis_carterae.AAC.4